MDFASILLGLALLLAVAFYVALPIVEGRGVREKAVTEADRLNAEREDVLTALRDLDFDHTTGKITDEDYAPQRAGLVTQGAAVIRQLEQLGQLGRGRKGDAVEQAVTARRQGRGVRSLEDEVEAMIEARRGGAKAVGASFCPQCGTPARAHDRFCAKCGTGLLPAGVAE